LITQAALPGFLVPGLAVAGALAVAIPIIIHILSRRPRKPEPWAAMRFLLAAYKKHRVRTRLEQWLLLATRCLLVLVLGMALAGLIWSAGGSLGQFTDQGRTVYIVLDNSITATAKDRSAQQHWVRLTQSAEKLLATLGPKDRVALITAARPVQTAVWPPSSDPMAVRRQIEQMRPSAAEADLPGALRQTLQSMPAEPVAPPWQLSRSCCRRTGRGRHRGRRHGHCPRLRLRRHRQRSVRLGGSGKGTFRVPALYHI